MKRAILLMTLLAAAGCGSSSSSTAPTTSSAPYSQVDVTVGTGATASTGRAATVNYSLWLYDSTKTEGKGSFIQTGNAFTFTPGAGLCISGRMNFSIACRCAISSAARMAGTKGSSD